MLANFKLHTVVKYMHVILPACSHLNMSVQKPAFPCDAELELGKVHSLFVKIIDVLGSDYVKEQEMLSATELGELSLAHAALTVQMK